MQFCDGDVVGLRERELRDQGHPHSGRDQSLHRQVVVGLERDARLEARRAADAHDMAGAGARLGGLHPGFVGEVGQRDPILGRQAMGLGQSELHRVLEQRRGAQPRPELAGALELEDQGQVELPLAKPGGELLGLSLDQAEGHVGMGAAEGGDRERHQGRAGGREGGHAQLASPDAGDRAQLRLSRVELREDPDPVLVQPLARARRADAAPVALEQRDPGLGLERRDRLGDGGLRVVEGAGRLREGALREDLPQHPEPLYVQH